MGLTLFLETLGCCRFGSELRWRFHLNQAAENKGKKSTFSICLPVDIRSEPVLLVSLRSVDLLGFPRGPWALDDIQIDFSAHDTRIFSDHLGGDHIGNAAGHIGVL